MFPTSIGVGLSSSIFDIGRSCHRLTKIHQTKQRRQKFKLTHPTHGHGLSCVRLDRTKLLASDFWSSRLFGRLDRKSGCQHLRRP